MQSIHRFLPARPANGLERRSGRSPFEDMDRLLEGFLGRPAPAGTSAGSLVPRAELEERETEFAVALELPGVAEGDLELNFEDGVLTVRGEKRDAREENAEGTRRTERTYGRFERRFSFAGDVKVDEIEARFDRGVLTVTLPKAEQPAPHRIPIRPADEA